MPQPFEFGLVDAGAGAAGIDQAAVGIVIGEQQRAEPGAPSFRIGSADHEGKPKPQQFCGFHEPGEVPSGLDNGLILDSLSRMFANVNHGVAWSSGSAWIAHHRQVQVANRLLSLNWGFGLVSNLRSTAGLPSTADLLTDGRHRRSVPIADLASVRPQTLSYWNRG
jgi:hypothetical protein